MEFIGLPSVSVTSCRIRNTVSHFDTTPFIGATITAVLIDISTDPLAYTSVAIPISVLNTRIRFV